VIASITRSRSEVIFGPLPGGQGGLGTIGAGALIMAIDGAAPAVLHAVNQRRFHPLAAIGKHRIGGDHLVKRGFLRAQGIGQERVQMVIDAEFLGIFRHQFHADFLRDPDRHQVARLFDPGAHRRRAIEFVRRILGRHRPCGVFTSIGASTTMVAGEKPESSAAA
jgi:hypothetical protein